MKQNRFLINLVFLILANLLVKPLWIFGIDRNVQIAVGENMYGLYFAIFNFSLIFQVLLDFGINNFNNRAIARHEHLLQRLMPSILVTKLGLSMLYMLTILTVAILIGFSAFQIKLLMWLAVNQVLITFILYCRSNITALHYFKTDSLLSILDKLLMIAIIGYLLFLRPDSGGFQIEWLVYAQVFSYALTLTVGMLLVLKLGGDFRMTWNWKRIKTILRFSYPFALVIVLMSIYSRVDAVMLERMLTDGAREAGIYAASYRILDAVNMVGFAFAVILLPMFSRMIKRREDLNPLIAASTKLIWGIAFSVALSAFFYPKEIMHALYPNAHPYWSAIFQWLMISFIGVGLMYVFGTLLTAAGKLRAFNWMASGAVVLNITLNYFLIFEWKALGATYATLITQLLMATGCVVLCISSLKIKLDSNMLLRIAVYSAISLLLFWLSYHATAIWILNWGIALAGSALAALATGLVDWQRMKAEIPD